MVVLDPRRTETAQVADEHHFVRPGTDAFVLLALLHVILRDGLESVAAYVDGLEEVRRAVLAVPPRAGRRGQRRRRGRHPPDRARSRRGGIGRGLRPGRRLGAGVRAGQPVGHPGAQHRHRQPRPSRRRAAHQPARRPRRPAAWSAAATTAAGAAGSAGCPSSPASCRSRRWPRRSSPRAPARSGRCSPWRATRCPPPRTAAGWTLRWPGSTSAPQSTSTSTRPPGTRT